ncbi:MAG TPA: hypothetical protein DCL15_08435 [Chloroflexi bacterium]|nr:hypothetical protein [Chloroflexota bacterium]HHW86345.1 SH3 domain-containing protein [Chloroflexota bacterium]
MNAGKLLRIGLMTGAALTLATLLLAAPSALAQTPAPLPPLGTVTSRITSSAGEEWMIETCPDDQVTVTMRSDAFTPFLSIFTDTVEAPVVEAVSADGVQAQTVIQARTGGAYTIVAAGERRSDRGDYSVGADFGDAAPDDLTFDDVLTSGAAVTGVVRSSVGAAWVLRGCAGAVVTATLSSTVFTPYVEIFDPATEETLAEGDSRNGRISSATATLPATGVYLVLVAGERRNDRGAYSLTLTTNETNASIAAAPVRATATPLRSAPTTAPVCIVRANPNLNVRSGPSTTFPPLDTVRFNTQLRPLARNLDATWVEIQPLPTGVRGWVAAGAQFISCTIDLTTLPVGILPPTPTPTPTAPPTPTLPPVVAPPPTPTLPPVVVIPGPPITPAPTLPPLVVLPGGGPGGGGWSGALVTGVGIGNISSGVAVFRDRIFFRAEIDRTPNNRRIDRVDFRIQDEFGDEFYGRTERTYGYCAFGGGEPACNVLEIRRGARWPDTNRELCNGDYTVFADIFLDNGGSATWSSPFTINHPDLSRCGDVSTARADLEAYVAQTGPGNRDSAVYGALVFQVVAYDPNRGSNDGDGIRNIEMRILDPDGQEVYQRTENRAAYCAFAGGEPDCNIWYFGDHGNAWPSGEPVRYGEPYLLHGRVNAEDGRTREVEMRIFIEP